MKIGAKLNVAFYSIVALLCISVGISFYSLSNIESKTDEALNNRVVQLRLIDEIRFGVGMQGLYARALMIDTTAKNRENLLTYAEELDKNIIALKDLVLTDTMNKYWQEIDTYNTDFNNAMNQVLAVAAEGDIEAATELVNTQLQNANVEILTVATEMGEFQEKQLALIKAETEKSISTSRTTSIVVLVLSILISVFLVGYVRRTITKPLNTVMNAAQVIAEGDLSQQDIAYESRDEIGQLAKVFNEMKASLRSLIKNVQANTEQLSAAAEELSASTEEISATTEDVTQQVAMTADSAQGSARAANESALAMEETAQGVQRIAEASQTLHTSSLDASSTATHGTEIIEQAKKQMNVINGSTAVVNDLVQKLAKQTEEIENITKVITDITDQTNLLALNAAIEAARAGEHGKGFAVVADEVRKLAEESKESANSIAALTVEIKTDTENVERAVGDSLVSVKDGVGIISEAGESFHAIVSAVDTMTTQIQEISATSEQLSASAEEVSASVNEISSGAQSAAGSIDMIAAAMEEQSATMQEVNSVAVSLNESAQDLQAEIQRFKI
jgi:methyl-accepting chemotaxis protein